MAILDPRDTYNGITGSVAIPNGGYTTVASNISHTPETIRGECVQAQMTVPEFQAVAMKADDLEKHVKQKLVHMIAEELLHNKLIEFTKSADNKTGMNMYRARVFATPDSQVRLLRKGGFIK